MKKWTYGAVLAILMCVISLTAVCEGLLPSLSDVYGVAMPSLGDVLNRYADSEEKEESGSTTPYWSGISADDFEAFSAYLAESQAELRNYSVENSVLSAMIGKNGKEFRFQYDPKAETATIVYPKGTYDERSYQASCKFELAKRLLDAGQITESYKTLQALRGYKEAESLVESDENLLAEREANLKPYKTVGNIITFGAYPQTDSGSDKTAVEWIVLDVQGNKSLLISRYGLDAQPYNEKDADVTWESCTLRSWLNGSFLNTAFSAAEQNAILTTLVDNGENQGYSGYVADGGNNTEDKVFLLSYAEAWKYFEEDSARMCAPTDYALKQGTYTDSGNKVDGKAACRWWLRSPGNPNFAMLVLSTGRHSNTTVSYRRNAIRPAFWLNLDSEIF